MKRYFVLSTIIAVACNTLFAQKVFRSVVNQETRIVMDKNELDRIEGGVSEYKMELLIAVVKPDSGTQRYGLIVGYESRGLIVSEKWLFIEPGESLAMRVNDQRMAFISDNGSVDNRERGADITDYIREIAIYRCTKEQLIQIATAKDVFVQITGQKGMKEFRFAPKNFTKFKEFLHQFALNNEERKANYLALTPDQIKKVNKKMEQANK